MHISQIQSFLSQHSCNTHISSKNSWCVLSSCVDDIYTDLHAKYSSRRSLVTVNFQLALASAIANERKKLPSSSLPATPCLFSHPFVMQHLLESAEKHETRGNMSLAREINAKFVLQKIGWSEMRRRNIKRWLCVRYITIKDIVCTERNFISEVACSQFYGCLLALFPKTIER